VAGTTCPDRVVAGYRQHVADSAGLQGGPQPGVGAVDLVASHPRRRHANIQRAADHGRGQLGLGRKPYLVGNPGSPQALRIVSPISSPPAPPRVTEVLDHHGAHVIADRVVVPNRPGQQVLHPVGVGVADVLSDRPAVLAGQVRQQAAHERPGPLPQLHPSEPARDPTHRLVEQLLPPDRFHVYAVACGYRLIFGCPHNTGSTTVAALVCSSALAAPDQPGPELRLEY
jgi:hypothetical protein